MQFRFSTRKTRIGNQFFHDVEETHSKADGLQLRRICYLEFLILIKRNVFLKKSWIHFLIFKVEIRLLRIKKRKNFIVRSSLSIENFFLSFQFTHVNGTKISIYRKNLENLDSPLEIKLVDPSGRMTSIFNYDDCIEQLNVALDTKQMLQKAIKVNWCSIWS